MEWPCHVHVVAVASLSIALALWFIYAPGETSLSGLDLLIVIPFFAGAVILTAIVCGAVLFFLYMPAVVGLSLLFMVFESIRSALGFRSNRP